MGRPAPATLAGLTLALTVVGGCAGPGARSGDDADVVPTSDRAVGTGAGPTTGAAPSTDAGPTTGPWATTAVADADPGATDEAGSGTVSPSSDGRAEVLFTGDLMLARTVGDLVLAEGPAAPWAGIADVLAEADLRVGNLETAVGQEGVPEDKTYTFRAPEEAVDALVAAGLDVLTLANNHAYDYGAAGLLETVRLLQGSGISTVGAGADREAAHAPVRVDVDGVELGFLGYVDVPDDWTGYANRSWAATGTTPGVAWADPQVVERDVAVLAPEVDHVVVLLHAGTEGSDEPDPTQVAVATAALDAGASAVIGAHPHVLQGWSLEDGRLVAWSLGNTVFDGFEDPRSLEAGLLVVTFTPERVEDVRLVPALVDDRGLPSALNPDSGRGRAILDRVGSLPVPSLGGPEG